MNEATTIEPATANPIPAEVLTGRNLPGLNGARVDRPSAGESAVPDFAVQLTEAEWEEQRDLLGEFHEAIEQQNRKRANEVLPKLVNS